MAEKGTMAYLSLGSNLGDRMDNLESGVCWLREAPSIRLMRISPLYETQSWGDPAQPDFLNCVASLTVKGGATQLLHLCQEIETRAGRMTHDDGTPRPLDIDILVFGVEQMDTPALTIPHPRLAERRFVLQPLADIAPNLVIPGLGKSVAVLLKQCADKSWIHRIAEVL
jgi:2-amino-4-hydroxy-6-hydroxymethyldihydropteridine diphosphokinase